MHNFLQIQARLFGVPLLLTEQYASVVATALADRLQVEPLVGREVIASYVKPDRGPLFDALGFEPLVDGGMAASLGYSRPAHTPVLDRATGIAVYPVVGSMVHRGGGMDALSGVQSYTSMQNDIGDLLSNPRVKAILMDLDTPGGEAAGITELARFMREASASFGKPIWGLANTKACSGGYWLGAACSKLYAAPMSSVGSIGVVTMHTDASKAAEKRGLVHTFIYAGAKKVDGHSFGPLSDATKSAIQGHVDALYGQFVAAVSDMRGIEPKSVRATEAGIFDPEQALKLGLIDGQADLGDTLAIMADHLSRSTTMVPGTSLESTMNFTQAQLDAAKAESMKDGRIEAATALASVMPDNAAVGAFAEMCQDGMSAAVAAKHAAKLIVKASEPAKVEVPAAGTEGGVALSATTKNGEVRSATMQEIDRRMAAEAPDVAGGEAQMSARDKRMAEIKAAGASFNKSQGYAN